MKILYLSTIIGTIDSFFVPHFKTFLEKGYIIDAAGNFKTSISEDLKKTTRNIYDLPLQRNPFSIKNLTALKSLLKLLKENKYDFIHVHTPVASVIGRLACLITKTRCFYTAHGFHFYKGGPLLNWLVFFPIEWILSWFTDTLICINTEDYEFAKKYFSANYTYYLPGVGIDIHKFIATTIDKKIKRNQLGIPKDCKLLLSVGELNYNKNHEVIIKALAKLKDANIHYAICGMGEQKTHLINLAKELGVLNQLHLLGYRNDISEILKCADVFVFPSIREGLGMAPIEAMASRLPLIISDNRGSRDFAINGINSFIVYNNDLDQYCKSIRTVLDVNYDKEKLLNNAQKAIEKYDIKNSVRVSLEIYNSLSRVFGNAKS